MIWLLAPLAIVADPKVSQATETADGAAIWLADVLRGGIDDYVYN